MKKFYISSGKGISGITKYSKDFYELVLKERGYTFIESDQSLSNVLTAVTSKDHVHIELGIFQKKEAEILFSMLRANYKNISVTLHDAPLIKYPFFEFKNQFLNALSKMYEKYGNSMGAANPFVRKLKSVYVLSHKGLSAVKKKYQIENVYYLPHIIDTNEIETSQQENNNLIYFGFIGPNKGIEYSLKVHQRLLELYPEMLFYVVGAPLGKQIKYYEWLQSVYTRNVQYLGYVPEEKLSAIFNKTTFALLPFNNYRFFWPFSGSVLYSLKKGKIVFANDINTISEIIENGKTGFILSGNLKKDTDTLERLISNRTLMENVKAEAYDYLIKNHSPEIVRREFKE